MYVKFFDLDIKKEVGIQLAKLDKILNVFANVHFYPLKSKHAS